MSKIHERYRQFISVRLKALRLQANFTQESFSELVGMGYKNYQNIEAGRHWNLRYDTLLKLITIHGLALGQFFGAKMPQTKLAWRKSMMVPQRIRAGGR